MKYNYSLSAIKKIEDGVLFFEADGMQNKIELKQSAEVWWDKHHKFSLLDVMLKKKQKNIYVGDKCFNLNKTYIRLYSNNNEIVFEKAIPEDFDTSDVCELMAYWEDVNGKLNRQGFWLFDEG